MVAIRCARTELLVLEASWSQDRTDRSILVLFMSYNNNRRTVVGTGNQGNGAKLGRRQ